MKKGILFISLLMITAELLAQTSGINTVDPKATLDVVGIPTDATIIDGVIAPRLTGNELKAKDVLYTAIHTGTIVYVTAAAAPTTPKTVNVTAPGYYYFDGVVWIAYGNRLEAQNALTLEGDIVELGGDLIKPTEISALTETNNLSITGVGVNMFNVDGTTFSVDGTNDRVGIGTDTPDFNLEAMGTVGFPTVATTLITPPYNALGINEITGQIGTFTPGAAPTFVRRQTASQNNIGSTEVLANIHDTNTSVINTLGVIHNANYLEIPQAGFYRIDYTVTGRMDGTNSGTATRASMNLVVLVNNVEVTQDRILYSDQINANVPSTIPIILELQANDRITFRYVVVWPTTGNPRKVLAQGNGANYSQQMIITKM
ncbi:hypothetical protein ACFSKL_22250 [Belliella marina]|uniref:C1q domain-containing protein n=1 Tax=Belliella marina TaxID=1644146 RepID=A0ABW4VS05_9BACT